MDFSTHFLIFKGMRKGIYIRFIVFIFIEKGIAVTALIIEFRSLYFFDRVVETDWNICSKLRIPFFV